jgi:hypothetical protein
MSVFATAALEGSGGRELILAIVGGTMLALALTRPRLGWVERLTARSKGWQSITQRGVSIAAFVVAGYTYAALFITLKKDVGPESATLIQGAAWILLAYALMIHFEPFVAAWEWPGEALGAAALYLGCVYVALMAGAMIAALATEHASLAVGELKYLQEPLLIALACWLASRLLAVSTWISAVGWLFYLAPRLTWLLERVSPTRTPARSTRA